MEIEKFSEQLKNLTTGRVQSENAISELRQFITLEKLDKDIVNLLIDKIFIHDEKDIEVVWSGMFVENGADA